MVKACPNFECLDYSQAKCSKFPACDGCEQLFLCTSCNNQAALVEGAALSCDLISLPEHCRFCEKRHMEDFSPEETCRLCPLVNEKGPLPSPAGN